MNFPVFRLLPPVLLPLFLGVVAHAQAPALFGITVVDDQTGRGIPLVELRTVNDIRFYTDSNGVAAIPDPDLLGRNVYFKISSPGYTYPKDQFGNSGAAFKLTVGGKATIKLTRVNVAERLYRITGAGIYRDSVLLGQPTPLRQPLINGLVFGQDTVLSVPYRGKLYWFWGDTNQPAYPLGQFGTSGATSIPPESGGLSPERGVDFTYWVNGEGFSRPVVPLPGAAGPVWVGGTFTLIVNGKERLFTHFAEVDHAMKPTRSGLAEFNDDKAVFESVHDFDRADPLHPEGHPISVRENGRSYLYFQPQAMGAFPLVRVQADIEHVSDPKTYEAYTCLAPGTSFSGADTKVEHGANGRPLWAWKPHTPALGMNEVAELVTKGLLPVDGTLTPLRDLVTDKSVLSHGGSVYWNAYRRRWILITTQAYGSPSFLGEVWFAEGDTPTGPWVYARKVATHDHYTFYNPTQHPFFDRNGGRTVYFEGTYTDTFSDVKDVTPRYNYNQLMYRLDLSDARLSLPVPVYGYKRSDGTMGYGLRDVIAAEDAWNRVQSAPFFAIPPDRAHDGLVPVYDGSATGAPLCYGLSANASSGDTASPAIVPLYAYDDALTGRRTLSVDANVGPTATAKRSALPIARVWRNPTVVLALDGGAVEERKLP